MRVVTSLHLPQKRLSSRQISAAAENLVAAQFAMYGFDVLEHGGPTRFFYDLGVANAGGMMKVTVRGSFRGFWSLADAFLEKKAATQADYHRAIERWLDRQGAKVTYCLVQFDSADLHSMPRIYLATAGEIAARLHESVEQLGDAALYEEYEVEDASGRHMVETLPARWRFSQQRIAELMDAPEAPEPLPYRFSEAAKCTMCAASGTSCVECLPMMN